MSYEKFLQNVALMNMGEGLAQNTRFTLLTAAHNTLQNEKDRILNIVNALPAEIKGSAFSQEQLIAYKMNQKKKLQELDEELLKIELKLKFTPGKIEFGPAFTTDFASYFKDIQHLADTLSDAPKAIKDLQIDLYLEVLSTLSKKDQENQFQQLTDNNIHDMLIQSIVSYNKTSNLAVQNNCLKIAQMGLYELIQRACETAKNSKETDKYKVYQTFLHELSKTIPNVNGSSIIDNFSDYRHSSGRSVSDLLSDVEMTLKIPVKEWAQEHTVDLATQRAALFHRLRFGQDDRREYLRKRQEKLLADLFWARDILDIERFTKGDDSDALLALLEEHRYLESTLGADPVHKIDINQKVSEHPRTLAGLKLEMALEKVKKTRINKRCGLIKKSKKPTKTEQADFDNSQYILTPQGLFYFNILDNKLETILEVQAPLNTTAKLKAEAENEISKLGALRTYFENEQQIDRLSEEQLKKIKEITTHSLPIGELFESKDTLVGKEQQIAITQMTKKLTREIENPIVTIEENGELSVTFFFYDLDGYTTVKNELVNNVSVLVDAVGSISGGFGAEAGPMACQLLSAPVSHNQSAHMGTITIRGQSLSDIEENLKNASRNDSNRAFEDDDKEKQCYLKSLELLKYKLGHIPHNTINSLKLSAHDELILRKLLELSYYHNNSPNLPLTHELDIALEKIASGNYQAAIQMVGIEKLIDTAYADIAKFDEDEVVYNLRPIVERANAVRKSNEARLAADAEIQALFELPLTETERVEKLVVLFKHEYQHRDIQATLSLNDNLNAQMNESIQSMAEDLVHLYERTKKGEPVLSEPEQQAYFSAIHQIATQLETQRIRITDVEFKIKHASTGESTIICTDDKGAKYPVTVRLGEVRLPYSLIKIPQSDDFMISFGGSRGVVAPFEGIEEKYGKKNRFFTRQRGLGYGQQASAILLGNLENGLNKVIKKGYTPQNSTNPTFTPAATKDQRTRGIAARKDTLIETEVTVINALAKAMALADGTAPSPTHFWKIPDSDRSHASLFTPGEAPEQYKLLLDLARGDTQADIANVELRQWAKGHQKFHDPTLRGKDPLLTLKDMLALSQAIMESTQHLQALGFSHNDIKPENFLYRRNLDGSYTVKLIDWATGGFKLKYQGTETNLEQIFKETFGMSPPLTIETLADGSTHLRDKQGRFVQQVGDSISFGVKPTLQILHGARHSTLPYISPSVLIDAAGHPLHSQAASVTNPNFDTQFSEPNSTTMDDWALTAMTFGICNRDAYFELVKGRIVADYFIPDLLGPDGKEPPGLKIIDVDKFNDYFACKHEQNSDDNDKVLFIPSNKREGEPLHLYRRLHGLRQLCREGAFNQAKENIAKEIDEILLTVHKSVAKGQGLNKTQLQAQLQLAEDCIKKFEQLHDEKYLLAVQHETDLAEVIENSKGKTCDQLLAPLKEGQPSQIEILCKYPHSEKTKREARKIVQEAFKVPGQFADKFLLRSQNVAQLQDKPHEPPCVNLLKACIGAGQTEVLSALLENVPEKSQAFIELVNVQGLLHYALEQNNTAAAKALLSALEKAGATPENCFKLFLNRYTHSPIKWSSNAFHIAIRNNNPEQLDLILDKLTKGRNNKEIYQALDTCAIFHNPLLFEKICKKYNEVNPEQIISPATILQKRWWRGPFQITAYHHFVSDAKTTNAIPWDELKKDSILAKSFLLAAPSPLLIAARNKNVVGITVLVGFGTDCKLTPKEWLQLFTQIDNEGKNILNHLLEHKQFDTLTALLEIIREKCPQDAEAILSQLLSNIDPINPLRNLLANTDDSNLQYKLLHQLLDTLSKDSSKISFEQQQTRVIALLVIREWLNTEAEKNPDELKALLQNQALSMPFKQYLFNQLLENSIENTPAQKFYQQLVDEVIVAEIPEEEKQHITSIAPDILLSVAAQRGDFKSVVNAFEENLATLGRELEELRRQLRHAEEEFKLLYTENHLTIEKQHQSINAGLKNIEHLEKEIQQRDLSIVALTEKISVQTTLSRKYQGELEELRTSSIETHSALKSVQDSLERKNAELKFQLDKEQQENASKTAALMTQLSQQQSNIGQLNAELDALKIQLATANEASTKLAFETGSQLTTQHTELLNQQKTIAELEAKLRGSCNQLQATLKDNAVTQSQLNEQLATQVNINKEDQLTILQLQATAQSTQSTINTLNDKLQQTTSILVSVKDSLERKNAELQSQLNEERQENSKKIAALIEELSQQERKTNEIKTELDVLKTQLATSHETNNKLGFETDSQLRAKQTELLNQQKTIAELEKKLRSLSDQLQATLKDNAADQLTIQQLQATAQSTQSTINTLNDKLQQTTLKGDEEKLRLLEKVEQLESSLRTQALSNTQLTLANETLSQENSSLLNKITTAEKALEDERSNHTKFLSHTASATQQQIVAMEAAVRMTEKRATDQLITFENEKQNRIRMISANFEEGLKTLNIDMEAVTKLLKIESILLFPDRLTHEIPVLMHKINVQLGILLGIEAYSGMQAESPPKSQKACEQCTILRESVAAQKAIYDSLAGVRAQLKIIGQKASEFPGSSKKRLEATSLHKKLAEAIGQYIIDGADQKPKALIDFKTACNVAIEKHKPILKSHRGFWSSVADIVLKILTLGKRGLDTDSLKKIGAFKYSLQDVKPDEISNKNTHKTVRK